MTFGDPRLLWLLLAAPAVGLAATWLWRRRLAAVRAWAETGLWSQLGLQAGPGRWWLSVLLLAVVTLSSAAALARPRWGLQIEEVTRRGLDVVFVLDSSSSMSARDLRPDRFFVATSLIRRLAAELAGSRVALVQFEGEALVLSPLTVDVAMLDLLLDPVEPGSIHLPGTRLGRALREAGRLLPPAGERGRAIVVVSDGEDHAGGADSVAQELGSEGVLVFAIGVGTLEGAPLPMGRDTDSDYKRDGDGRLIVSRLEESGLEKLARASGGDYLRADSAGTDLKPLLDSLGGLARGNTHDQVVEARAERFQWPLTAAVACLGLWLLLPPFRSPGASTSRGSRR